MTTPNRIDSPTNQEDNSICSTLIGKRYIAVSYNMHGINQVRVALTQLTESIAPDAIMLQEHWLSPDNLFKLNDVSPDYFVFGSSAMLASVCSGPLVGRPFGGTALFVKKKYLTITSNITTTEQYTVVRVGVWLLISV